MSQTTFTQTKNNLNVILNRVHFVKINKIVSFYARAIFEKHLFSI